MASGFIEQANCAICSEAEKVRSGCNNPLKVPVWYIPDKDIGFFNCPYKFLRNESVMNWYNDYMLLKNGLIAPDKKNDRQARWYDAVNIFEEFYNFFSSQKKPKK